MTEEKIKALADYFTGPVVAAHSMGLAAPAGTPTRLVADRFYQAREALGITGYASADEAMRALQQ